MPLCPLCGRSAAAGDRCTHRDIEVIFASNTFVYADYRHNLIVDADHLIPYWRATQARYRRGYVRGYPYLAGENSEDALTWNVFRSLEVLGGLSEVATVLWHIEGEVMPLYWTFTADGDGWPPLNTAHNTLESHILPHRQRSEPDLVLVDEQHSVVFVEAKFGANLTVPEPDWYVGKKPHHTREYRTRILDNYRHGGLAESLFATPLETVIERGFYELARHVLFAAFIAAQTGRDWRSVALISPKTNQRNGDWVSEFAALLREGVRSRFHACTWCQVYEALPAYLRRSTMNGLLKQPLGQYLSQKTYNGQNAGLLTG